jgi:tRNA(Ile)-lysidine synthase TilS/MesJ
MLEQYCEQNNIKLFSFSWNEKNNNYFKDFKTFYSLDFNKIKEFVSQYEIKHPNVEGSILARDNQHVGSAYHNCWAEHIYSEYERSV